MDSRGLVHLDRPELADDQRPFAVDPRWSSRPDCAQTELTDPVAIARAPPADRPHRDDRLPGASREALVREVARHDQAPIILPLSNPGDRAEARPADILAWTDGRALVATGEPERRRDLIDGRRVIGQANNVFIFPGRRSGRDRRRGS